MSCNKINKPLVVYRFCNVKYWREFFSAKTESWKKLKASNLFSSFIVNLNQNRSAAPVRDLLRSRQQRYVY